MAHTRGTTSDVVQSLTSSQSAWRSVLKVVLRDGSLAVFATQGEVLK